MVYIHRKATFCTVIGGVRFLPGMNTISDSEMDLINKDLRFKRIFKSEISCKNMVIGGTVEAETTAAVDNVSFADRAARIAAEIRSVDKDKAITLIENQNDTAILKQIQKIDVRKGIQDALTKRISDITNQVGSDLGNETVPAPNGDGSNFASGLTGSKDDLTGSAKSAIPALNS